MPFVGVRMGESGVHRMVRDLKGFLGYGLDLLRILRLDFKNPHSYTKFRMIRSVQRKAHCRVLIEAGTYFGATADRCSRIFDQVYTIELDERLAEKASDYLKRRKNVRVMKGDALHILPQLLQREDIGNVLIYLDGHFCGDGTACGIFPEPAVEELRLLSPYKEKINAVIVDDFRSFGSEEGFPAKSVLLKSAEDCFMDGFFETTVFLDQLLIVRTRGRG
ncbi:MAG: hypothetical protein HY593_04130 [Candidatus Omnitrophica bacterium]|nr:hypothetical protein [Candidatus Omnitrophota bacterium]